MNEELDYFFCITIVGDPGTGKSNFLKRLFPNLIYEWDNTQKPTRALDFSVFHSSVDQHVVKLLIWDTTGDGHLPKNTVSVLEGPDGLFMVYDITKRKTFESFGKRVKRTQKFAWKEATMILVGNKSDLEDAREVSYEEGRLLAEELGMKFVEISERKNESI